ncbi:MAG: hypothetical protein ACRDPE_15775 [Solirubrobacterales bacterium]
MAKSDDIPGANPQWVVAYKTTRIAARPTVYASGYDEGQLDEAVERCKEEYDGAQIVVMPASSLWKGV